jgi:2-polyprenyl-3-methyl-5-hydroxy-6-metoxy-1,4-benzoquinol methylase
LKPLEHLFLDLGSAPPSNAYLSSKNMTDPEIWFPLRVRYCANCWLVQTEDFARSEELFTDDYAYFSSMSSTWLAHAAQYTEEMTKRFGLGASSKVVEIASNDGYLLRNFQSAGIPNLGIEPTKACAEAAEKIGIKTIQAFFGQNLAGKLKNQGHVADLIIANNVLAHVPDINDFIGGFTTILKDSGVATFEFPHLLRQVEGRQFDTVYHEHFSYLSLTALKSALMRNGLAMFDVQALPTHGGSLRVFVQRADTEFHATTTALSDALKEEAAAGLTNHKFYQSFQSVAEEIRDSFVSFLIDAKRQGKHVAAYGAAAKGNTLMNFAGIRPDLISYVVDKSPMKLGRFMPGSRIPIVDESEILKTKPDIVVILPWNIQDEISDALDYVRDWNGKFAVAVPKMRVF